MACWCRMWWVTVWAVMTRVVSCPHFICPPNFCPLALASPPSHCHDPSLFTLKLLTTSRFFHSSYHFPYHFPLSYLYTPYLIYPKAKPISFYKTKKRTIYTSGLGSRLSLSGVPSTHWGWGPMEMGVYMLGTFQALSQGSSNVPTRYISFTFQM